MKNKNYKLTFSKGVLFGLSLLCVVLLGAELLLRVIIFQRHSDYTTGISHAFNVLNKRYDKWSLQKEIDSIGAQIENEYEYLGKIVGYKEKVDSGKIRNRFVQYLYQEPGQDLLRHFQSEYERHFEELRSEVDKHGAKLVVLFVPLERPEVEMKECRRFYKSLAEKNNVTYLDCTDELTKWDSMHVYLYPENGHFSRLGNQLVAEFIKPFIEKHDKFRADYQFSTFNKSKVWGDKEPNSKNVLDMAHDMIYKEVVNSRGFRMNRELPDIKEKQRVLFLGDSFTEGPFLPNHDTYPGLLQKMFENIHMMNAGVGSYSIQDQKELYLERAKFSEADLVFLQVLNNDISDMFYFYRNFNNRQKVNYHPTKEEKEFFNKIKEWRSIQKK